MAGKVFPLTVFPFLYTIFSRSSPLCPDPFLVPAEQPPGCAGGEGGFLQPPATDHGPEHEQEIQELHSRPLDKVLRVVLIHISSRESLSPRNNAFRL